MQRNWRVLFWYKVEVHQKFKWIINQPCNFDGGYISGVNLELAVNREATDKLQEAFRAELVSEDLLRANVKPLFRTRMQLGEFDPPELDEYRDLTPYETVQSKAHIDLAKKAAKMSFVLLKNRKSVLPLKDTVEKVAVIHFIFKFEIDF